MRPTFVFLCRLSLLFPRYSPSGILKLQNNCETGMNRLRSSNGLDGPDSVGEIVSCEKKKKILVLTEYNG